MSAGPSSPRRARGGEKIVSATANSETYTAPGTPLPGMRQFGLIAGVLGAVLGVAGFFVSGVDRFFQAYLVAYTFWMGVFMPAKTPPAVRERLHAEIVKALKTPVLSGRLAKLGSDPFLITPAQFDALIKQEIAVNTQLVKAAGIVVN